MVTYCHVPIPVGTQLGQKVQDEGREGFSPLNCIYTTFELSPTVCFVCLFVVFLPVSCLQCPVAASVE